MTSAASLPSREQLRFPSSSLETPMLLTDSSGAIVGADYCMPTIFPQSYHTGTRFKVDWLVNAGTPAIAAIFSNPGGGSQHYPL